LGTPSLSARIHSLHFSGSPGPVSGDSMHMNYLAGQAALESAQADLSIAEFHGTFCALICTRSPVDNRAWVKEVVVHGRVADDPDDQLWCECLAEIGDIARIAFEEGVCDLEILLPDDEQPLAERSQALVDWCSGFLYGFALQPEAVRETMSPDAREVIDDIVEFTHIDVTSGVDDGQVDERSFVELVEYLRVGVLLIYEEIIRGATLEVADSGPLH